MQPGSPTGPRTRTMQPCLPARSTLMAHFGNRPEIDHRTIKLIVGGVALGLAPLTIALSPAPIASISASYHEGGAAQSVFVGFLFAIAALLLAYNGLSRTEMILSKGAAAAGLGVALFPCTCGRYAVPLPWMHGLAASVMFLILAWFCLIFWRRARAKRHTRALRRARLYALCGAAIVLSMAVLALNALLGDAWLRAVPRLVLYGEATALTAFGIAWLTASHALPWLNQADERFAPWRANNPP